MSDSLDMNVDFNLNSGEVAQAVEKIKKEILGVGLTTEQQQARIIEAMRNLDNYNKGFASSQKKASKEVVEAINEETKAHERSAAAINKKKFYTDESGRNRQVRPVTMSDSQAEIDAANASKSGTISGGAVVGSAAEYNNAANAALQYKATAVDANQAATDAANRTNEAVKGVISSENSLKLQLESYKNTKASATDPAVVEEYRKKIELLTADIARLGNVGKRGYDELGNRIKSTIGIQEQLTTRLKYFQDQLQYAKAPQSFVALNRKIEETQQQLDRLANAGKKGFDELGNKIKEADTSGGKFLSTLKMIGAAILAAFSIQMITSWIKESRELAARGEGIREAFSKLGNEKTLDMLRTATRGATSDIDLMAAALRAKNFQIAPELLAKGLELAGKVSRQTGQDVTYLADSFVNGLGRKSLLILDNLQISQVQLRAEIKKTGDFQTAVANVVDAKLKQMGDVAETSADRMARWTTKIANYKEKIGQVINLAINYDGLREATKEFFDTGLAVQNLQNNIAPLLTKYDQLSAKAEKNGGITKLNKVEQTLMKDIIKQVGDEIPGAITQFDKYGNAISISTDRAKKFIAQQVLLLQALNEDRISKTIERIEELKVRIMPLKRQMNELAETGQITITASSSSGAGMSSSVRAATKAEQEAIEKKYKAIAATIAQQEALKDADSGELLKKRQAENDKFAKITKTDDGKAEAAAAKAAEKQRAADAAALSAQESLLQRIQVLKDKFARKGLDKEAEARQAITDEFKKLAFDIEQQGKKYDTYAKKYGAARANSVLGPKQTTEQLEPLRKAAIGDLEYRQDVEKTKLKLELEKKLYADFEEYKSILGDRAAKDRFSKEINTEQTRLQRLQAIRAPLFLADPKQITGGQSEYLTWLNQQIQLEKDAQENAQQALLKESMTFEDRKLAIKDLYEAKLTKLAGDENAARREELKRNYQEQVDGLITAENAKSDVSRRLAEEALILTRSQIKEQIAALENALKDVTIPESFREKINGQLKGLKVRLDIGADQANLDTLKSRRLDVLSDIAAESKKAKPNVAQLEKDLMELNKQIKELDENGDGATSGFGKFLDKIKNSKGLAGAAVGLGLASDAAFTLSEGLGGVESEAGYTLDTIGQLAGAAGDLAGAIVSGDPAKMIGAAIKAVGTLFSIGKKVREMNLAARKEVADFYAQAISGEREYQDLLKQRALQTIKDNKTALQGIIDETALRKAQNAEYVKEAVEIIGKLQGMQSISSEEYVHGTWFRKAKVNKTYDSLQGKSFAELSRLLAQGKLEGDAKALVERLVELEQKGYDAEQALADLAKQTAELFTGTTSDALTNSLVEMFKSGKTGAQDLADFFKDTMDDAALSIFKNKVLAVAMDKFYDSLVEKTADGELSKEDYADLKEFWNTLNEDSKLKYEALKELTGSDLGGGKGSSSKAGTIAKALTEQGASELTGLNRNEYFLQNNF